MGKATMTQPRWGITRGKLAIPAGLIALKQPILVRVGSCGRTNQEYADFVLLQLLWCRVKNR